MSKPTIDEVISEVRNLAFLYAEAQYHGPMDGLGKRTCYYDKGRVTDGPPGECGCIFGIALRRLWPDVEITGCEDIADELVRLGIVESRTDAKAQWCWVVQDWQDGGTPWGNAVYLADVDAIVEAVL